MKFNKINKIKYSYDKGMNNFTKKIPTSKDDWTKKNKRLKKIIKEHYSIVQNDKCAYCREDINFGGYGEPIEHIIPKSEMIELMYHPQNLCLACYGCNTKKGKKNPLKKDFSDFGNTYNDFPKKSSDYKIIHPHFDAFSYYIEEKDFIFKARKDRKKGEETILICDLNRFDLLYKRIRKKKRGNKNLISYLTNIILLSSNKEEIKISRKMLLELIKRYEYMKKLKKD